MAGSLTGTIIAEKYKLGELLRSGEHGDLYDARHVLMDKPVSVRVLRPGLAVDLENVERFFSAAKTASKITDPHVHNISDFGTDHEGFVYAVYEPLEGRTLKSVIAEDGTFPVHTATETATQIAEGLAASHPAGQIHGNLSTENVMLTGSEGIAVKVVEFGSPNPLIEERTEPADFAYLAPELCSGADTPDERSDVYSLGVILYEMLAGVPPFTGDKPTDVLVKHIEEMPPPLADFRNDLPEGLEPVIAKALSKSPDARQQTAREFADELVPVSGGLAASAATAPNNLWKTAFIVLVGMTLLGSFLIYGTYVRRTDPATAMQPDANSQPVQPINPATGTEEQTLAAMPALTADAIANSNQIPGTLPGGDGYNPWATGAPPPGAPIPPGGQVVTIPPANGSPFMPSGILYDTTTGKCVDATTYAQVPCLNEKPVTKPTPTPKTPPANANTAPQATPTPQTSPSPAKPTPTPPVMRPSRTPSRTPANRPANTGVQEIDQR
jgi:serine/threonine-protein kinase